jgi:multiple sugar transport system ATP-binding protein
VSESLIRTSSFAIPTTLAAGRKVIAGIRPEHITVGTTGAAIQATVELVEPIGHETIVYVTAGSEKLVAIFDPHDAPRVGNVVALSVDPARVHVFDAESGARI